MSSSTLVALELAGTLGLVLIFGFWQLWSLRKEKLKDQAQQQQESADKP